MTQYPLSNVVVVTPPVTEPLTNEEAVEHLRVDSDDDQTLILRLISTAREHVERETGRCLITRTLDYYCSQFPGIDPWPRSQQIEIPRSPLQSIVTLQFTDTYGTVRSWTPVNGGVDLQNDVGAVNAHVDIVNEPGRIVLAYSQVWPNQVLRTVNGVKIRFTSGYGADATTTPPWAKQAMLLLIGTWYDNRESIVTGRGITSIPLPDMLDEILAPNKIWNFA